MTNEEHYRKLENMYRVARCNIYYSPTLLVSEGQAQVVIPVKDTFFHSGNAVHGSVYFKALDDAAFFAANSIVEDVLVLTATFNIYLMRPISSGEIMAHGRVSHSSHRWIVAESRMVSSEGQEIAKGSGSFVKSTIRLSPEIGYQ